ncbi:MAG: hypothetical protein N7Q72_01995, partial [Spiroplasma sp. Tabriz.8]|nr:hypothetical protein [Spiroplasma sp. Tabriz.8]
MSCNGIWILLRHITKRALPFRKFSLSLSLSLSLTHSYQLLGNLDNKSITLKRETERVLCMLCSKFPLMCFN